MYALISLSILLFILYSICIGVCLMFFIDNSPFSVLPFSNSLNNVELMKILIKYSMAIFGSIATDVKFANITYCIFLFLALCFLLNRIYDAPPFLTFPFSHIHDQVFVILIWINFMAILQMIFHSE